MSASNAALHVVVPAYNEARHIADTVTTLAAYLGPRHPGSVICVVDDGSADETVARARAASANLPGAPGAVVFQLLELPSNRGKGHAVRVGMREARAPLVLFSDADLSTPIEEIEGLLRAIEGGADVAIASRATSGARVQVRQPLYRVAMGKTFNRIMRMVTGLPFADTQCGFKLFRREVVERIVPHARIDGFAFDVELLLLSRRAGFSVVEVPVRWVNEPESKVHPVWHSAQMLRDLLRIRWLARTWHL